MGLTGAQSLKQRAFAWEPRRSEKLEYVYKDVGDTAYLMGPMAGLPNHGYDIFEEAAKDLRDRGFVTFSPHDGSPNEDQIRAACTRDGVRDFRDTRLYAFMMRRDFMLVLSVRVVFALPGWGRSQGARSEAHFAQMIGTPIYEWETGQPMVLPVITEVVTGGSW